MADGQKKIEINWLALPDKALGLTFQGMVDPRRQLFSVVVNDEQIQLDRNEAIGAIHKIIGEIDKGDPDFFNNTQGWDRARSLISTFIDIVNSQPSKQQLEVWERQREEWVQKLAKSGYSREQALLKIAELTSRGEGVMAGQAVKEGRNIKVPVARVEVPAQAPLKPPIVKTQIGTPGGPYPLSYYLRHPVWGLGQAWGSVKSYFANLTGRGAKTTATSVAEKVAKETAGKTLGKGAKKVATGALAKGAAAIFGSPVGTVIVLLSLAKDALGLLTSKKFWKAVGLAVAGVTSAALIALKLFIDHLLGSAILGGTTLLGGTILSFTLWPILGPLAVPVAFAGSYILGSALASSFGVGTAGTVVTGTTLTTTGGLGALLSGTTITTFSLSAILTPIIITALAIFTNPPAQAAIPATETEGPAPIITVLKSADKTTLPNDSNDSITYSVTITNPSDKDIQVSIEDKIGLRGKNLALPLPRLDDTRPCGQIPQVVTAGSTQQICYQPYLVKPEYNDSNLDNVVTVTANIVGDAKKEVETASVVTKIGSTPNDQPFGFPSDGQVVSLDQTRLYAPGATHKGTVFSAGQFRCPAGADRCWQVGGMDITNAGGTPVYATVDGTVVYSAFDYGDSQKYTASICSLPDNYALQLPFGYCAVGGVVEIDSGQYTVSYLHLQNPSVRVGDQVTRGQVIGHTYDGPLPTSTNPHVHYQVFLNSNRFDFATAKIGKCSEGAILPLLPSSVLPPTAVIATTSNSCD